jgi:hypothetical protein
VPALAGLTHPDLKSTGVLLESAQQAAV